MLGPGGKAVSKSENTASARVGSHSRYLKMCSAFCVLYLMLVMNLGASCHYYIYFSDGQRRLGEVCGHVPGLKAGKGQPQPGRLEPRSLPPPRLFFPQP